MEVLNDIIATNHTLPSKEHLRSELVRKITFDPDTEEGPWCNADEWAAAGFYYTGISRIVKCVFCEVIFYSPKRALDNKESLAIHKKYYCEFARGLPTDCGNIPSNTIIYPKNHTEMPEDNDPGYALWNLEQTVQLPNGICIFVGDIDMDPFDLNTFLPKSLLDEESMPPKTDSTSIESKDGDVADDYPRKKQ